MGSSQLAPVQQVVNTIEQFGYHPATVFKFFVVIGIIAKVLRKATQQDAYIEYERTRSPPPTTTTIPPPPPSFSTFNESAGTMGFFLLIILSIYTTAIWCLLSKPICTSLFQFTIATMVWSANPIQSIILLHNENMATSCQDGRMLNLQPILPAAAASTYRRPRHLLTMLGLSQENDLSEIPPDTSICARSSFEKICLRI